MHACKPSADLLPRQLIRRVSQVHELSGGRIYGPTFNGTVVGGLAYPLAYGDKGDVRVTQTMFYGNTSDGGSFLFQNSGVGDATTSFSRVVSL